MKTLKKHSWKIIIATAVLLMVGAFYAASVSKKSANEGVVLSEHILGNPNAAVTLIEYSDFQCPACAQFQPIVEDVIATYGENIRFEYKHFPLISIHPHAIPAAVAAEAAGQQGEFFAMANKLFENQTQWSSSPVSARTYFIQYAEDLGLDTDLFKRHLKSSILEDKVKAEFEEARVLGLSGTPTFFLNGEPMVIESLQDFRDQIEVAVNGTTEMPENSDNKGVIEFGI